jgi:hypothetical protein
MAFQRQFYELKIMELSQKISILKHELDTYDFNAKMREYSDISMKLFMHKLFKQYATQKRTVYNLDDLWKNSESFIQDYPVILSTTYSLCNSLGNQMYDYVIVDESSQVDLCTGALALSCARRAVIVGDLMQLPPVVSLETASLTDNVFTKFDLPETYRYRDHSLLASMVEMFSHAPRTLLKEHYRCHPKIIEFCNKKFYDGQLIILTEPKNTEREPLMVYRTVEGNHERVRLNQRQIDVIKNEIIPEQQLNTSDGSLGIVTPYRKQTEALQQTFFGTGVKADTVDKFQGQENEIIILSTVDNDISNFADNANRLNVAVSRAIEQLIVVVSDSDLSDTNIGDLVRYVEYNSDSAIIQSKIYSVFDYLYQCYATRRREFLAKYKRVSEYDSENLMYALITEVLMENKFKCSVAVHVPLRTIIKDASLMTPQETLYAMNALTHVDFLIFEVMGKTPLLAIEVDGVAFHAEGTAQAERDTTKNEIFNKYGLSIYRFSTDGSGERQKLIDALNSVLGN